MRSRPGTMATSYLSSHGIEFTRRRSSGDCLRHGFSSFGNNSPRTSQGIELVLAVNRH
jgi:hypothetical protein